MKSLKVKGFYCRNFDLIAEFYYFCPICQDKFSVMKPCKHYDKSEPPEYVWLKLIDGGAEMIITNDDFQEFLQRRFNEILELRKEKAREYTKIEFDENFKKASLLLEIEPEQVALYYMTKHIVSIYDIVENKRNMDKLREKVNDVVVYLLLIEAMLGKKDKIK